MENFYTIGELAKKFKVTNRALRFYEEKGLLSPEKVDEVSGYRYYTIQQAEILRKVLFLKELGLSLDEISQYLIGAEEEQERILIRHKKDSFSKFKSIEKILDKKDFSLQSLNEIVISGSDVKKKNLEKLCGVWQLEGIFLNIKDAQANLNSLNKVTPYKFLAFNEEGDSPWFYRANSQKMEFNTFFRPVSEIYQLSGESLYLKISNPKEHIFTKVRPSEKLTSPHILKFNRISENYDDWKKFLFVDDFKEKFESDKNALGCWKLCGSCDDLDEAGVKFAKAKAILLFESDGSAALYGDDRITDFLWSKGILFSENLKAKMHFKLKGDHLILEWKTRSYNFTNMISDYLVFEKSK